MPVLPNLPSILHEEDQAAALAGGLIAAFWSSPSTARVTVMCGGRRRRPWEDWGSCLRCCHVEETFTQPEQFPIRPPSAI